MIRDLFQASRALMGDPKYLNEAEVTPEVKVPDGRSFRMTWRVAAFHPLEQYNEFETIFYVTHPGGRRERAVQKLPLCYLFRSEAEHLLARCGFRMAKVYGSFEKTRLKKDSIHMLIVAEKMSGAPANKSE